MVEGNIASEIGPEGPIRSAQNRRAYDEAMARLDEPTPQLNDVQRS